MDGWSACTGPRHKWKKIYVKRLIIGTLQRLAMRKKQLPHKGEPVTMPVLHVVTQDNSYADALWFVTKSIFSWLLNDPIKNSHKWSDREHQPTWISFFCKYHCPFRSMFLTSGEESQNLGAEKTLYLKSLSRRVSLHNLDTFCFYISV